MTIKSLIAFSKSFFFNWPGAVSFPSPIEAYVNGAQATNYHSFKSGSPFKDKDFVYFIYDSFYNDYLKDRDWKNFIKEDGNTEFFNNLTPKLAFSISYWFNSSNKASQEDIEKAFNESV